MAQGRTIVTERLSLRPHMAGDFADMCSLWRDATVTRHIGGNPFTPEEIWMRLLRYAGTWSLCGYGFWIIHERESGQFVGEVGYINAHRDLVPSLGERPEFGYALLPQARGKGFAGEAAQAAIAWGDRNLEADEIVAMIDPGNEPSLRLAGALGFLEYARTKYKGCDVILLSRHSARAIP